MTEMGRIGIVGGGQLGMMLTEAAIPLGLNVTVVDPTERLDRGVRFPDAPARRVGANQIIGDLNDPEVIRTLAKSVDVVTWEIEHINTDVLIELAHSGTDIQPSPDTLAIIKDKLQQKKFLRERGIPTANFFEIENKEDLAIALGMFKGSAIVKSRFGGFDGRGNLEVHYPDWEPVATALPEQKVYAEEEITMEKELAVIIVKDKRGNLAVYPPIETVHENNICVLAVMPASLEPGTAAVADEIARETVKHLQGAGVFVIEMFVTPGNDVLVNEIAPRVHNSGHLTIEANRTSQFEQHVRAVSGLPLGSTEMLSPAAMANILHGPLTKEGLKKALALPDAKVHLYGKEHRQDGSPRKIGHVTVRASTRYEAVDLAIKARRELLSWPS